VQRLSKPLLEIDEDVSYVLTLEED